MSFDPTKPVEGTEIDAAELRNQFNGLKALLDAIPPGEVGPPGPAGRDGTDGGQGPQGPAGVDGRGIVSIDDDGMGRAVIQMSDGTSYGPIAVASGPQGAQGPQGAAGEVSAQQLSDAINGTSASSNSVIQLSLIVSDPPTQSEMQSIANKLDELIGVLRRYT